MTKYLVYIIMLISIGGLANGDINEYNNLVDEVLKLRLKCDSIRNRAHRIEEKLESYDALKKSKSISELQELRRVEKELEILVGLKNDQLIEWEGGYVTYTPKPIVEETNPINPNEVSDKPVEPIVDQPSNLYRPSQSQKVVSKAQEVLPNYVIYSVQLGVFGRVEEYIKFKELDQLYYYQIPGKELFKHCTGIFNSMEKAKEHLKKAKSVGYSDAFVVAFYNAKPTSLHTANQLKK